MKKNKFLENQHIVFDNERIFLMEHYFSFATS